MQLTGAPALGVGVGSVAGPALHPASDPDTGLYFPAADTLAAAIAGVQVFSLTTDVGIFRSPAAGASGFDLQLYQESASPGDGDVVGTLSGYGNDDNATPQKTLYAQWKFVAADVSDTTEDGQLIGSVKVAGTMVDILDLSPDLVVFKSTAQGAAGIEVRLYQDSQSPASGTDVIGNLTWYGRDSAQNVQQYAGLRVVTDVVTSGAEDASFDVRVVAAGTMVTAMSISKGGVKFRGTGTAASPEIKWTSLPTSGIYNPQNGVGLACNGSAHLVVNHNGSALTLGFFGATPVVRAAHLADPAADAAALATWAAAINVILENYGLKATS